MSIFPDFMKTKKLSVSYNTTTFFHILALRNHTKTYTLLVPISHNCRYVLNSLMLLVLIQQISSSFFNHVHPSLISSLFCLSLFVAVYQVYSLPWQIYFNIFCNVYVNIFCFHEDFETFCMYRR